MTKTPERSRPWQNPTSLKGYQPKILDTVINSVKELRNLDVSGDLFYFDSNNKRIRTKLDLKILEQNNNFPVRCFWEFEKTSESTGHNVYPKWEGQFDTFSDWVNHATRSLTGVLDDLEQEMKAFCVDTLGRRCKIGKDFMRARDENTFPVRYFFELETPDKES